MADKTIWDYPTLATADPNDLILMASDEETYNMKVETLKNAMGEAASKPPIVRNGNWWVWSATQNDYVDSGTAATGPAAGFGTVSATVDSNTGTPSVNITTSGSNTAKNIQFAFHNIKGETGTVTPEVQALANAAAQSATNAADSASSASASQQAAAQSAQEAASTLSSALPKANVYNALDKTVEGFALDARQGKVLNERKQDKLTFDTTPNAGSTNPVTSDGIKTALNAKLDKANVYNGLDKTASGFALDARKGAALNDSLSATQSGIAIIVDGDTVTTTIAEGQYVYIKGSTVLAEGLYTAITAVPSGTVITAQTAATYFTAVSGGGLNAIQQSLATFKPGDNYFDKVFAVGYTTGSGNYFGFFIPGNTSQIASVTSVTCLTGSTCMKASGGRIDIDGTLNIVPESTVISSAGITFEVRFASTQEINTMLCVILVGLHITCT